MKIECTLPNASECISGIAFSKTPAGTMMSEDVAQDVAAHFLRIDGYRAVEEKMTATKQVPKAADKTAAKAGEGEPPK